MSEVIKGVPEAAAGFVAPKPIDVRGMYAPGIHGQGMPIRVETHYDLMSAGIKVSMEPVEATWGQEAAAEYIQWAGSQVARSKKASERESRSPLTGERNRWITSGVDPIDAVHQRPKSTIHVSMQGGDIFSR